MAEMCKEEDKREVVLADGKSVLRDLAEWMNKQKRRRDKLIPLREKKLNEIGFPFHNRKKRKRQADASSSTTTSARRRRRRERFQITSEAVEALENAARFWVVVLCCFSFFTLEEHMLGTEGKVVYNDLLLHKVCDAARDRACRKGLANRLSPPWCGPRLSLILPLPPPSPCSDRSLSKRCTVDWGRRRGDVVRACRTASAIAHAMVHIQRVKMDGNWPPVLELCLRAISSLERQGPKHELAAGAILHPTASAGTLTHSGHGLWSQLIASLFLLPAIGASYRAITTHSSRKENRARTVLLLRAATFGSVCVLSHMFCGYIVFASAGLLCIIPLLRFDFNEVRLRLLQYSFMLLVIALQTAYFVVPFIVNREHAATWNIVNGSLTVLALSGCSSSFPRNNI